MRGRSLSCNENAAVSGAGDYRGRLLRGCGGRSQSQSSPLNLRGRLRVRGSGAACS
jgi:hypothetical protein